jgi:hypothetical protein
MHIGPTTHEHRDSAKVYTYEGEYDVHEDGQISWQVEVTHAEEQPKRCSGTLTLTSSAAAVVAQEAVRDAIIRHIDSFGVTRAL